MIYLIGGVAKGGKTYIARKIMEEKLIPYFSTDFLLWSMSDKGGFSHHDPDSKVSPILEPFIITIIDYLVWNEDDYVLEGTHITPSLVQKVMEKYPGKIKSCFLGYENTTTDEKVSEIMSFEKEQSNRWYRVLSEKDFKSFIKGKIEESKTLKDICDNQNLKYFEIHNIEEQTKEIIKYLFI